MKQNLIKLILIYTCLQATIYANTSNKTIKLNKDITTKISSNFYNIQTGTKNYDFPTEVSITPKTTGIKINFKNDGSKFVYQNDNTTNNSELYDQEVFEVFIHSGDKVSNQYFEFELNPNAALFNAYIKKAGKEAYFLDASSQSNDKTTKHTTYNKLAWQVTKDSQKGSFSGELFIPYSLINKSQCYRANFLRIASYTDHSEEKNWKCNINTCSYLAFNPTYSTTFHIPDKMVILDIDSNNLV
ncbi:hypothetical protein LO80_01725 [Candidatus Francisella endociliophora]|uniref:Uncharacterized protein n=1 Tax=Candidatus Francisella endociliophora TaxID=653937 RepID=A0A097EMM2_9GAMM|nr:carbohydrate-binding family 9-like protein [Francisella sp. FSC1006]AIT08819.1 hypothetical protein LO80_01725 [Francisella sp. FSC1006]